MWATYEELRATQEIEKDYPKTDSLEDLLARWSDLSLEGILAGNLCIEGLADELYVDYLEIDWEIVESQGWT